MAAKPPDLHATTFLICFLLLHGITQVSALPPIQRSGFSYGPFKKSDKDSLEVLKDASINGGALQLTPDTRNNVAYLQNKSGRVLHRRSYRLWDNDVGNSTRVASFNTTFVVNIYRDNNVTTIGDGLAFIIAPNLTSPPAGSEGGYLGLTNVTTDGNPFNHLVAVELDTFKQPFEPDGNHVGLDVNSVHSVAEASLKSSGVVLSPVNATKNTVWIEYNGSLRRMVVYIADEADPKPQSPVLDQKLDLSKHLLQDSYFGFSGSTGDHYQLNCVLSWNLTVEVIPVKSDRKAWKIAAEVGVPLLVAAIVVVAWATFRLRRRKGTLTGDELRLGDTLKSLPGMLREFSYNELKKATGNFDEKNVLGKGGFGVVYKGTIECDGVIGEVAVKMFSKEGTKMDDFLQELTIINRLRHRNLVRLFGWCSGKEELLLVYEYMPMRSLNMHLYQVPPESTLPWDRRRNILGGVASALYYLHNEYEQKVIHRDIKSGNILLDSQFNARLGDFGLARTIDASGTSYAASEKSGIPGTVGYLAPECFVNCTATRESDVYAFGAVILEVVCGRRPVEPIGSFNVLVEWVRFLHGKGRILEAVDKRLNGDYDEAEAERLLLLGLDCSQLSPKDRPKTEAILQMITGYVPVHHVRHSRQEPSQLRTSDNEDDDDNEASSVSGDDDYNTCSSGSSSATSGLDSSMH